MIIKSNTMIELFKFKENTDLKGYTLVIPCVSVGNVPQLTADLLISSLDFAKAATVWHPAVVSLVGPDPYQLDSSEICTACELYVNNSLKLAVLQLRSTIEIKLALKFFEDLKQVLLKFGLKDIVILSSGFDYELHVVSPNKFYFISNQPEINDLMTALHVKPQELDLNGRYVVHGSGFGVKLYEVLKDKFSCTVLIKYVSEGDNRPDAINMLEVLSKFVEGMKNFTMTAVKFPSSWSGVFGGPPPLGIY